MLVRLSKFTAREKEPVKRINVGNEIDDFGQAANEQIKKEEGVKNLVSLESESF